MKQHYSSIISYQFIAKICMLVFSLLLIQFDLSAQVAGDLRSTSNGNWNASSTWERFTGTTWEASGIGANNPGQIPDSLHSVFIQSGHSVSIDANAFCLNITINSGADLIASSFVINSYGIWTNNGNFSAGSGTVTFNGLDNVIAGLSTTSFFNVDMHSVNATTLESPIIILHNLLNDGGTFKTESFDVTVNGLTTISGLGSIKDAGAGLKQYNGGLEINGGSFVSTVPITIPSGGVLNISLGNLTINAGANNFLVSNGVITTITGGNITIGNGQSLTFNSTVNMSGGVINGGGSLQVNADLNLNGGSFNGGGSSFVNAPNALNILSGTNVLSRSITAPNFNWVGGNITIGSGAVLSTLTSTISSNGVISGNGTFAVSGIGSSLVKSSNSLATINCPVAWSNPALINLNEGSLAFGGGGSLSGTTTLSSGTTMQFNVGNYNFSSTATVTGTSCNFIVSGATVNTSIPLNLNAASSIAVSSGTLSLGSPSTIEPPVSITGGTLAIAAATVLNNVLTLNGGTITSTNLVTLANTSIFSFQSGTLNINAGSSAFTVSNDAVFNYTTGTINIAAGQTFDLSGATNMANGTITGSGALSIKNSFTMNGGTFSGAGLTTVTSLGTISIGGTIVLNRSMNVNTSFNWISGNISMATGVTLSIINGATATMTSSGIISSGGGGGGTITVSGVGSSIQKNGNSISSINAICNVVNPATLQINDGTLSCGGGGTLSGSITISNNKTLQFSAGSFSIQSSATLTGNSCSLIINGGTVNASVPIGLASSSQVSISSGTLTLSAASTLAPTISLTGGTLAISSPTIFANTITNNGGTITTTSSTTMGAGTSFIFQSGSMDINTGTGTFSIPADVTCVVSGGTISISSGQVMNVAGSNTMSGGTINGVGNYTTTSAFVMSGGAFNGNGITTISSPGTMTISGNVNISRDLNTPTLNWISGNVSLSGTLTVGSTMTTNASGTMSGSGDLDVPTFIKNGTITTTISNQFNVGNGGLAINGGMLTLGSDDPVTGNLSIASGAKLRITNGKEITAQSLTLGGYGAIAGTWGSNSTAATNKNDTYFDLGTTGEAIISTNTCITPVASISSPTTQLTCATPSIILTGNGTGFYTWNNASTSTTRTVTTPGTYSLTISSNGCGTSSSSINITQDNVTPDMSNIGGSFLKTCTSNINGNTIGEPSQLGYTYAWSPSTGLSNASISNPIANPSSTTMYTVTKTKISSGCFSTANVTVTVNTILPIVSAGSSFFKNCISNTTGASIGEANDITASYAWTPVEGLSYAASSNPIANPSLTTVYTITKTQLDNGCVSTATVTANVDIASPTNLQIMSGATTLTCTTTSIMLSTIAVDNSGGSNLQYNWSNGINIPATLISTPALYSVTATDPDNGCTASSSLDISSNTTPPSLILNASFSTICEGASTSLNISGADSYEWAPIQSTLNSLTVTPSTTTTYTVTGTNALNGCTSSSTITIVVKELPNVTATSSASVLCEGNSVTLNADGASEYHWEPGLLTGASQTLIPTASTTYTVTGTNSSTGCLNSTIVSVTVNPLPNVSINASSSSICNGNSTTLNAIGGITYEWQPIVSTISSLNVTPLSTTTYTVTGTNSFGCTQTSTKTITVNNCNTSLNLKLFIEGYYRGGGIMAPVRANQGLGTSSINVDQVTVELHNSTSPYATIASAFAILKTDGTLTVNYTNVIPGSYYIVVRHRNAIKTWSAIPVTTSAIPTTYDFTTDITKAFGDNMTEVESGIWALYSGDITSDDNIDLLDMSFLEFDVNEFASGFVETDINGDGNVDLLDTPLVENNVNNFVFASHP